MKKKQAQLEETIDTSYNSLPLPEKLNQAKKDLNTLSTKYGLPPAISKSIQGTALFAIKTKHQLSRAPKEKPEKKIRKKKISSRNYNRSYCS